MALLEQHYTVQQVAEMLSLGEDTIRSLFRDDPEVLKVGRGTRRGPRGYVKGRITLRIPQSAVLAKMKELAGK